MRKITVKIYDRLNDDIRYIRETVFVQEQGFGEVYDEIDDTSVHLVIYNKNSNPIGACRIFKAEQEKSYIIGRFAVLKEFRGENIGLAMLSSVEKHVESCGGNKILLHAQERVKVFYEKGGFTAFGAVEYEQGCAHIWMSKNLD